MDSALLEKLLRENLKVAQANNKILKGLRQSQRLAMALKILYWVVIIVLVYVSYQAIMPAINSINQTYLELGAGIENIQELGGSLEELGGLNIFGN